MCGDVIDADHGHTTARTQGRAEQLEITMTRFSIGYITAVWPLNLMLILVTVLFHIMTESLAVQSDRQLYNNSQVINTFHGKIYTRLFKC